MDVGAGFRFHLSKHLSLSVNADYFIAKFEFETKIHDPATGDKINISWEQPMNTFFLTTGISYRIK